MRKLERDDVLDRLPDFVLGTLPAGDRAAVEAAIVADASLARELAVVRRAHAALTPAVPAMNVDRIVAAVAAQRRLPVRPFAASRWRVAAAIATLAVGGASLGIVRHVVRGEPGDGLAIVGESTLVATGLPSAITFGYGLSELGDDDLEAVLAELENFDGLPAAEPRARAAILPVGSD